MLRIAIRFCIIIGCGFLAMTLLAGGVFGRVLIPIIVLFLLVFFIARIGSGKSRLDRQKKETPEVKTESGTETENVVDGEWHEIRGNEAAKDTSSKEMTAAQSSPSAEPDPLQSEICRISEAAGGIRSQQIRGYVLHLVILAKDIIREHDLENEHLSNFYQFENYYIPTLKSVVCNYKAIEEKGMTTAKLQKDMIAYLESCDSAFTKLYHSMFEDDVFDMEVKMEAMNIILKRDGLL